LFFLLFVTCTTTNTRCLSFCSSSPSCLGGLTAPTGIPPHIGIAREVNKVYDAIMEVSRRLEAQGAHLASVMEETIKKRELAAGHLTGARLAEMFDQYKQDNVVAIGNEMRGIAERMQTSFEKELGMRLGRAADDGPAAPPAPAGGGGGGGDVEDGGTGWGGGGMVTMTATTMMVFLVGK